jgi:hypothetical protein
MYRLIDHSEMTLLTQSRIERHYSPRQSGTLSSFVFVFIALRAIKTKTNNIEKYHAAAGKYALEETSA